MSAKIRLELDNVTKKGFDEIIKDLERLSRKAGDARGAIQSFNQTLNDKRIDTFAVTMKDVSQSLHHLESSTELAATGARQLSNSLSSNLQSIGEMNQGLGHLTISTQDATRNVEKLAIAGRDLQSALNTGKIQEVKSKVDELGESMKRMSDRSEGAGNTTSSVWGKVKGAFGLAQEAFGWVQSGFSAIGSYVQKIADGGNSAFQKLVAASSKFQESLDKVANSEEISRNVDELADAVGGLAPDFTYMGKVAGNVWSALTAGAKKAMGATIALGEAVGAMPEGMSESYQEEGRAQEELQKKRSADRDKERAENEAEKARKKEEARDALLNPGIKMTSDDDQDVRLKKLKGLEGEKQLTSEINALLEKQAKRVSELETRGANPAKDQKVVENAKLLTELEKRRIEIRKENSEKDTKLSEMKTEVELKGFKDEIKHIDWLNVNGNQSQEQLIDLAKRRAQLVKEHDEKERQLLKDRGQLEEDQLRKQLNKIAVRAQKEREAIEAGADAEKKNEEVKEARRKADEEAEQKKVDKLKQFMKEQMQLTGGSKNGGQGQQGADLMGRLQGSIKPIQVQKQVIKNREESALAKWRQEKQSTGKMNQDNTLIAEDGESMKTMKARTAAQERSIRRQAKMSVIKDSRQGKLGNEEVAEASGELLQQAGENVIGSNKLNQTQVSAIRQTVQELRSQQREQAQLRDELDQIGRQLQEISTAPKSRRQAGR